MLYLSWNVDRSFYFIDFLNEKEDPCNSAMIETKGGAVNCEIIIIIEEGKNNMLKLKVGVLDIFVGAQYDKLLMHFICRR